MEIKEHFIESESHHLGCLSVNEHLSSKTDEPAIVFIHGILSSINFWLDIVPDSFKEDRAWYSLSLPSAHPSKVPDDFSLEHVDEDWFHRVMNGALKKLLGDRKAILIGHSTGGFCAINLAINKSPNVIGFISVAGFHSGKWGGVEGLLVKLAGMGKWTKGLFIANLALSKIKIVQRIFSTLLANKYKVYWTSVLSEKMLNNIKPNIMNQDFAVLFPIFNRVGNFEIKDRLSEINVPCYIFAGTHDPVISAKQSVVLMGEIPNAKAVSFYNVGHMPFMEDTEAYLEALENAIEDLVNISNKNKII